MDKKIFKCPRNSRLKEDTGQKKQKQNDRSATITERAEVTVKKSVVKMNRKSNKRTTRIKHIAKKVEQRKSKLTRQNAYLYYFKYKMVN
ncbi:hypothetical protein POVCU2_0048050 [Plasmodium ovale curtisi]|uniref:Uncharacterized protein n=1 Tax=Plasmodium ovale curtisi TaxID=864141 RepID=A0A1A8W6G2_PLAOA|nr:hypothetical protein POVCU2_0048050 [Plasmodium ovale curtisi]SBS98255.1 hypothetical protein POVCU1_044720 [Plasmodium ovale curtisi]